MMLGDAMTMREAVRRGELLPQDIFSLGMQTMPASSLAMKPQTIEMFAGFFEEDYAAYARIVGSLPSTRTLNAAAGRQIHSFCHPWDELASAEPAVVDPQNTIAIQMRGPLWLPVDPRHNPPDKRPTHANVNAAAIEKIWERYA